MLSHELKDLARLFRDSDHMVFEGEGCARMADALQALALQAQQLEILKVPANARVDLADLGNGNVVAFPGPHPGRGRAA